MTKVIETWAAYVAANPEPKEPHRFAQSAMFGVAREADFKTPPDYKDAKKASVENGCLFDLEV